MQLFPGTEPVGERVTLALDEGREQEFTVVGVSADFATSQLTTERPQILLPLPTCPPEPWRRWKHLYAAGIPHRAGRARRRTEAQGGPGERAPRTGRRGVARCGVSSLRDRTRPRREKRGRSDCGVHRRRRCRRGRADPGRARDRRRRRLHGGDADTRTGRADGARGHASRTCSA